MSDATTPYMNRPADPNPPIDQMPTQKDTSPPKVVESFRPRQFGDYELLSEVARGGMGVVYRARQNGLSRIVALKMILGGRLATPEDVQRFRTEAEAAARLKHPNIVSVFDVGEAEGQHFFSMEFIEGISLSQLLLKGPLTGVQAVRYLRALADAMYYAHRHDVVHRDLKPSNILLDADDKPHITDFGLAKRMTEDQGQTRTGTVLGTPSYMAPEQAQGRTREVGPAADIYSLGAILYECLTGRPPFRGDSVFETVNQVINDAAIAPRTLRPGIDADLERICMKCLEKDPALRYADAAALGEDLRRYADGEAVSARSLNVVERIARVLDRSQHDVAFQAWSSMLFVMAGVIAVEHVLVYLLMLWDAPRPAIFAARFLQYAIIGLLFLYHRGNRLMPTTAAERGLWSIWIGYFVTYGLGILATRTINLRGIIARGPEAPSHMMELLPYPFISLVAGLAFFVMGSNYWGRCYLFGVAFWTLAVLMPLRLEWAPLEFGLVWTIALTSLGLHLNKLARRAEAKQ